MRIPLPKSKLVTLALVALMASGVAAASLASPGLWSDPASTAAEGSQRVQSVFAFNADQEDEPGEDWDHDEDDERDDFFDDD